MEISHVEISCARCEKIFTREKKQVTYSLKKNKDAKFFCSTSCFKDRIEYFCEECGIKVWKTRQNFNKTAHSFCSKKCSITYSNRRRSIKDSGKIVNCAGCSISLKVSIYCGEVFCKACKPERRREVTKARSIRNTCTICSNKFLYHAKKKTCSGACLKQVRHNVGVLSASNQLKARRSKNEIHFANLCKKKFSIQENRPIFKDQNGYLWDADIIIQSLKIAVLWNGAWHYKPIVENRSLFQIQTRDKIKLSVIKDNGYTPYIIKDLGRANKVFVQSEFDKFLHYIEGINEAN